MDNQTSIANSSNTTSNSTSTSINDLVSSDTISIDDEYLKGLLESLNHPILQLPATQVFNDILYCISILPLRTCRYHMRSYKDCFTGDECVLGVYTFIKVSYTTRL